MSLQNSGERQIIFLSSQFIQEDNLLWLLAGVGILLIFFTLLVYGSVHRRNRQGTGKVSGAGLEHVTGDTAEMPAFQDICLEHYGFRIVEDITYIHTSEKMILEEDGGYDGMDHE